MRNKKLNSVLSLVLAMVILVVTTGFSLHTITCQMTGEVYSSAINTSCCCGTLKQHGSKICCSQESIVIKLDTEYTSQQVTAALNPVFGVAFIKHFIKTDFPKRSIPYYFSYLKKPPPLPDQKTVILVQSFLL